MKLNTMTVEELYATFSTEKIELFFRNGLETGNGRLAVTAMEELILRCAPERIVATLDELFEFVVAYENVLVPMLATSLAECPHNVDSMLPFYGNSLLNGEVLNPTEWVKKHSEEFCDPPFRGDAIRARVWAKKWLKDEPKT